LETGKWKKSGNQTVRVKRCEADQASLETGKQRTVPTRDRVKRHEANPACFETRK
jgi:hypothetical protein